MLDFNTDFQRAIDVVLESDKHVFVTGKAGTGKSTFLRYITEQSQKLKVVLAPTGLAAINIDGQTIHSFFKLPPSVDIHRAQKIGNRLKKNKVIQNLELMIIDEISMVRADMLDIIDQILRTARSEMRPFGGVQVVFIGDLYQLPPIVRRDESSLISQMYATPYFFSSKCFKYLLEGLGTNLEFIELTKIYRQTDQEFINLLNDVRYSSLNNQSLQTINERVNPNWQDLDDKYIVLTTRNADAADINYDRLSKLDGELVEYRGKITGDFSFKNLPTELTLELKVGARVMFVKNHAYGLWVNGSLGFVKTLGAQRVVVTLDNGNDVEVGSEDWEVYNARFDDETKSIVNEIVGGFSQIPLKLSWAITIHKSQGQTFEKMILDLGKGAFSSGQTYVALSRCKSLDGLVLANPIQMRDVQSDQQVRLFLHWLEKRMELVS
jgi:ATP-dependent DNA helicase PIF1